jgi:hypothetical protein
VSEMPINKNPNNSSIQEKFAPFFARNIIPTIAGVSCIADIIGYASAIAVENDDSPSRLSIDTRIEGIKNIVDNIIENNQIFLEMDFLIGAREIKRKAIKKGYVPT